MAWVYLMVAGLFEIGFTTALRYTESFSRLLPSIAFVACAILSFTLLQWSTETIPLGTAYAVWTGIGAAGTALIGMLYFDEPTTTLRLILLVILIGSIIGLRVVSEQ